MLIVDVLIGLGIFLFGMTVLERSIELLGSGWIKRWLAQSTRNPATSVLTGTAITAVLQSSSMVGLVILAFASAGIIPLYNAIGVLLGANLGTTFTGWVVATLGFKLELSVVALPAVGLGCLIQVFADVRPRLRAVGALIFGLGLLLFGLGLMKEAVAGLPDQLDMGQLKDLSAVEFLLLGTILTAIIQSSSATMMLALTAVHTGIIDLPGAAALVIGADLGTTSTTVLGSIKGSIIKRQLALAHFVFNLVVDLLAFIVLLPALPHLLDWLGLQDPLYGLVAFHSTFNVLGLFLFIPFLRPYSNWIGQRFNPVEASVSALNDVPINVPEAAIKACQSKVKTLLVSALFINLRNLRIPLEQLSLSSPANKLLFEMAAVEDSFEQRYEMLKQSEGELLRYTARLQQQPLDIEQANSLQRLLDCARDAVYGVKALKDIRPNLLELRHTPTALLQQFPKLYQDKLKAFYQSLLELIAAEHDSDYLQEQLQQLSQLSEQLHQQVHSDIRKTSGESSISTEQLSTLLNINREIWHANRNLLKAMEHWYGLEGRAIT
ncbi:MAG: Na/Pi symporter [Halioglobus sp.]